MNAALLGVAKWSSHDFRKDVRKSSDTLHSGPRISMLFVRIRMFRVYAPQDRIQNPPAPASLLLCWNLGRREVADAKSALAASATAPADTDSGGPAPPSRTIVNEGNSVVMLGEKCLRSLDRARACFSAGIRYQRLR